MRCLWIRGFNLACRKNQFVRTVKPESEQKRGRTSFAGTAPHLKPVIRFILDQQCIHLFHSNLIERQFHCSPCRNKVIHILMNTHEPPVLHEHWFASHPQSEQVQFSPQHTHAAAPALLKVARANSVATTAPSSASPANDLINIEISFVNIKNRNKTTRRYSINESKHKCLTFIITYRRETVSTYFVETCC